MRQIFPQPGRDEPARADEPELVARLAEVYAYPGSGPYPWVRANMITSVDGAISVEGRSGGLSGSADRLLFHVLRGLADVILVGAGTARTERYGLAKPSWPQLRQGRPAAPPIASVTRGLDLDLDSPLLQGDASLPPTIVLTTRQAPADRLEAAAKTADVFVVGEDAVSGTAAIDKLAELGHRRILVEGGPTLLGEIALAGRLDELCVTTSPIIVGGGSARMIASPAADATGLELATLLEDDGFLLARYVRAATGWAAAG